MKKITLLLILTVGFVNAQIVNIPDANFKAELLEASPENDIAKDLNGDYFKIDANDDGEIQVSEALFTSYLDLYNSDIADMTGIEVFTNLVYLDCFINDIEQIDVTTLINLEYLKTSFNPLTNNLDVSQNVALTFLSCYGNSLSALDLSQNINLEHLECTNNQLTTIDLSQNPNLSFAATGNNTIGSLDVSQNLNLTELYCHQNQLTELDVTQNINLEILWAFENQLTNALDVTQNSNLIDIRCYENQISELDLSQNTILEELYCSDNQLTSLNITQCPNLKQLRCANNQIPELNIAVNTEFVFIRCDDNLLTTLDASNNSNLEFLFCRNNQLTSLFVKNGNSTESVGFTGNTNLQYICADEAEIAQILLVGPDILVNSYCSFSPGGNFNTITGHLIFDADNNGCDPEDALQPNIRVDINDGTNQGTVFSNSSGSYTFFTDTGDYSIQPNWENDDLFNFLPSTVTIPFSDNNNNVVIQDFCISANGIHNDVEAVITPIEAARPGFDAVYQIVYKNKGNQMLSGSIDFTFNDTVLDFVSASVTPDNQIENNLSWNYSNLFPFESRVIEVTLNVNSPMETPAVNIDDVLHFNVSISPVSEDETPLNNNFEYHQIVVGSYDPNDITCLEGTIVSPEKIGDYLHYNINFENTGTAAATFIVVRDEIDETKYDINSLQVLYSSHDVVTRITDNLVEFIFNDINLEAEGKGNVLFKIKTKSELVLGDSVSNKANIYFDYNFPIETNTATTVFDVLSIDQFEKTNFRVFPNPVQDLINVSSDILINSIAIYDIHGRLVTEQLVNERDSIINSSDLQSGIYILKIKSENKEEESVKLIKN